MTPTEAGNALGLSRFAIWKAIARGSLVADGAPGNYTITSAEVERYRRERLGRRGPITTRCAGCGHSRDDHRDGDGACDQCGDEYTLDPRLGSGIGSPS